MHDGRCGVSWLLAKGYRRGVGGWESLRVDLQRLIAESPGAFLFGPNPDSERRYEKRIRFGLAAWATDIAAVGGARKLNTFGGEK